MFKTLLFPTDFSPAADHAFDFAVEFAKDLKAEIVLLHAYHYSQTEARLAPVDVLEGLHSDRKESAIKQLEGYRSRAARRGFHEVEFSTLVKDGFAQDMILEAIERVGPDLIIMGCQGLSSLSDRLLGSVTLAVMREASRPVLAIPAQAQYQGMNKITYATDFEEEDLELRLSLRELSHQLGAELCAVHIDPSKKLERSDQVVQADWSGELVPVHFITDREVEEGLLRFIQEEEIQLLAVLPHERQFFEGMFHKNLTNRLARHLNIPLLAFHAKG